MSTIFNTAIRWDYITYNPNSKIQPIKIRKKEMQFYNPEEVAQLVNVLENEPIKYKAIILLALDSGCRRGELTGLTWEDIDFAKSTIEINKETQYSAGYGTYEKSTKSETSNRKVYITPTTLNILKLYRREQLTIKLKLGSAWQNSLRVFVTDYGADMHPNTPSKILANIIKRHNLKSINFHGLRHTSISLQISSGIQAQIISKRAGHSTIGITHNIYSHFFDSDFKDVADKMNGFLKAQ